MRYTTSEVYHQWGIPPVRYTTSEVYHQWGIPPVRYTTSEVYHQWGIPPVRNTTSEVYHQWGIPPVRYTTSEVYHQWGIPPVKVYNVYYRLLLPVLSNVQINFHIYVIYYHMCNVKANYKDTVLSSDFWPEYVGCRPFFRARKQPNKVTNGE